MAHILIVDDEKSIRQALKEILEFEKYKISEACNGNEAFEMLSKQEFDLVISDIKMPVCDGLELLQKVADAGIRTQFIMLSAHATVDTAVEATRKGAFDFLVKPPDLNRLLITVRNALEKVGLVKETKSLRRQVGKKYEMIGESEALGHIRAMIEKVAPTEARVLIMGPNGSGKELVARAIHAASSRHAGPLVEVNCAAIASELIESELFGHEKGAFTSALRQHAGKFEQAENGTLFLDEIGDMSLSAQAKVLRALQEHKIQRVGGEKDILVNARILAATNKNLIEEIAQGRFREDLYHRISVILIEVPPLCERKEDISLLIQKFLVDISKEYGSANKKISPEAVAFLTDKQWPGNIRQLHNVVARLIIMSGSQDTITESLARQYA